MSLWQALHLSSLEPDFVRRNSAVDDVDLLVMKSDEFAVGNVRLRGSPVFEMESTPGHCDISQVAALHPLSERGVPLLIFNESTNSIVIVPRSDSGRRS